MTLYTCKGLKGFRKRKVKGRRCRRVKTSSRVRRVKRKGWVAIIKDKIFTGGKWETVGVRQTGKPFLHRTSEEAFKAVQGWYGSIPAVDFKIKNLKTKETLHPWDFGIEEEYW